MLFSVSVYLESILPMTLLNGLLYCNENKKFGCIRQIYRAIKTMRCLLSQSETINKRFRK